MLEQNKTEFISIINELLDKNLPDNFIKIKINNIKLPKIKKVKSLK
jgi:hypothetical protein